MTSAILVRKGKFIVPFVVLGATAYIDYVSCYVVAWNEVYLRHSTAAAIVFWVLLAILQALHLLYWSLIFVHGPGHIPKFQNFDLYNSKEEDLAQVPAVFVCDEQGYPYWCSKCQNLKPDRSFHSTDLDTCVPRFDHFCLWIGTAIGRDNLISFYKYLQWSCAYAVLVLSYVAIYARPLLHRDPSKLPHFIVVFILTTFGFVITYSLLVGAVRYTFTNSTSFDVITRRQATSYQRWQSRSANANPRYQWCNGKIPRAESGYRFLNVSHNGHRKVVTYNVSDHPYSNGFKANLVNMCLYDNYNINSTRRTATWSKVFQALVILFVPFADFLVKTSAKREISRSFEKHSDEMSSEFLHMMTDKIERNEFQYAHYLPVPTNPES